MGSRIVKSPAGQDVEIVDDEDWCEAAGVSPLSIKQWKGSMKPYLIGELWLGGPSIDEKTGRATALLMERARNRFPDAEEVVGTPSGKAVSGLMNAPQNAAAFSRTMNGKRTYAIELVAMPEKWFGKLSTMLNGHFAGADESVDADETGQSDSELVPQLVEEIPPDDDERRITDAELEAMVGLDAPTVYDVQPPMELAIASQVAMSLLTTVVEIITAGSSEAIDERVRRLTQDMTDVQGKLALRLQENDTLRRQLRTAGDEIIALRSERDGLRSRLRATEANLTAALKGDAVQAINTEIQRRVDTIMRAAPKTKGDG